jgi:hypothetical protein
MSYLLSIVPAQVMTTYARPFLGLGALLAILMVFKPLVLGLLRAAWLTIKPRQSLEQRMLQRKLRGMSMLERLATKFEASQPNLAAELRVLAGRD